MRERLGTAAKAAMAAAAIMSAGMATAARWQLASRAFSPQRVAIDKDSIVKAGDTVTVWAQIAAPPAVPGTPQEDLAAKPAGDIGDPAYLVQISCVSRLVRLSAQGIVSGQANPFGPADSSPYTFQPLNNGPAYAIYSAVCPHDRGYQSGYTKPNVTAIKPSTRGRTTPYGRNPWPIKD